MDEVFGELARAVYDTVHDFRDTKTGKRGAVALAPRLGMLPGTLANKANPMQDCELTLSEAGALQLATQDFRILQALAWELGHAVYALPEVTVSDMEILTQYTEYHAAIGAKAIAIRNALADGCTPEELAEVQRALEASIRAGLGLLARLEVLAA